MLSFDEESMDDHIFDCMDPKDILLARILDCPKLAQNISCELTELNKWRQMKLRDAYISICNLPLETQRELANKCRNCHCTQKIVSCVTTINSVASVNRTI